MWDDVIEEDSPAPAPEEAEALAPGEGDAAAVEEADTPAPENVTHGYEPKKLITKHWIRPSCNQYKYILNYRQNYYNDVINYLDRRNQGYAVEKPRAQEWGERALRSYFANSPRSPSYLADAKLLRGISTGARFHRYHTKSLISRKYSRLGFNTVSI